MIEAIEAAGYTQKAIADRCGTSQPYISQLKNGERKSVNFEIGDALRDLHSEIVDAASRPSDVQARRA